MITSNIQHPTSNGRAKARGGTVRSRCMEVQWSCYADYDPREIVRKTLLCVQDIQDHPISKTGDRKLYIEFYG
jgi:hypothetical protein